jgi:hypothetical protein
MYKYLVIISSILFSGLALAQQFSVEDIDLKIKEFVKFTEQVELKTPQEIGSFLRELSKDEIQELSIEIKIPLKEIESRTATNEFG